MTPPVTHREVELKFRVHGLFQMPDLVELGVAPQVHVGEPFEMEAVYHDTAELTLFRWGVTLRRREGGKDAGWHMKLPVAGADGTTRDEIHLPLDAGAIGSVPASLVQIVAPLLHELPLEPVVRLSTMRTPTVLANSDGQPLVEVVDDIVTVRHEGRTVSVFREIEVEVIADDDPATSDVMRRMTALLIEGGAEPSSVSKAASALGPRTAEPPDVPAVRAPDPSGLAVDAIRATLSQHVRSLLLADVGVRRDLPDSVHQMRVSARRLRSTLGAFAPLLHKEESARLREELKWIASELGAIRDTEVMMDRLSSHAADLVDPSDSERCREAVASVLGPRLAAARSSALAALRSDRHQQLVDDLMDAAVAPPVTNDAYRPCEEVMPSLVADTWRRLVRSITRMRIDGPSAPWHEARIKAKQARYTAEAIEDVFGKSMRRLANALAEVTEVLGDHQDAYVAQNVLRDIAAQPSTSGATGMSLGLLFEYECHVEMHDRFRFKDEWARAQKRARSAGLA